MEKKSDVNRRKFMEIGIYTITGTIAAVSGVALARFAVGTSFEKKNPNGSSWTQKTSKMPTKDLPESFWNMNKKTAG